MGVGKIVSQACHACLGSSEKAKKLDSTIWNKWYREGAKKVVVKVSDLDSLLDLERQAKRLKLPNMLVIDKGLTQIPPNTPTSLGIGPVDDEIVDRITEKLKLL